MSHHRSHLTALLTSGLIFTLAGCQAPPQADLPQAASLDKTSATRTQAMSPEEIQQEAWIKSSALKPAQVDVKIDWDAVRTDTARDQAHLSSLPQALRDKLATIPMPVLLPRDPKLAHSAFLTQGDGWHALDMEADGLHVSLHGWSRALQRPDLTQELGDEALPNYRSAHSHKIWSVSFNLYGAAYTLDVECAKPGTDPRCADDKHAQQIAHDLVLAGGAP